MQENDYAVVVGISRYPKLKDLQGPTQDAEDFLRWLAKTGEVPGTNIEKVLSDAAPNPGDRPVQEEIDRAFDKVFQKAKTKQGRRLYFYFAGHGCSAAADHIALLMANASMDYLNYALNAPSYHDGLARKPLFREHLIFYDCCRNYDRRVRGRDAPWTTEDPGVGAADVKQFILYGSAFTQYANERAIDYSDRRGLFTKALLEGLEKAAVRKEGRWVVTTDSLVPYVAKRLKQLAKKFELIQEPSRGPGIAVDIVIAEITPTFYKVTVEYSTDGAEVIVKNQKLKEIKRATIEGGKVQFELVPGLYQFAVAGDESRACLEEVEPDQPLVVTL